MTRYISWNQLFYDYDWRQGGCGLCFFSGLASRRTVHLLRASVAVLFHSYLQTDSLCISRLPATT